MICLYLNVLSVPFSSGQVWVSSVGLGRGRNAADPNSAYIHSSQPSHVPLPKYISCVDIGGLVALSGWTFMYAQ